MVEKTNTPPVQADESMQDKWNTSYLDSGNSAYLDALYETYLSNPEQVDAAWRECFEHFPKVNGTEKEVDHSAIQAQFLEYAKSAKHTSSETSTTDQFAQIHERKQVRVLQLINAYRTRGHQKAHLDPISLTERPKIPDLELEHHQLSADDLDTIFNTGSLAGSTQATLREIYEVLNKTYCDTFAVEFAHITDTQERNWIQHRLEGVRSHPNLPNEVKLQILSNLIAAEGLERYLHTKYVGQKRFSLEGGESLIPMMEELIQRGGAQGVKEIVIGMAHRGRLNVLVNILGKVPRELFEEFEGKRSFDELASGDVKYHQGFSSDVRTSGGDVHLALAFNPSHLEIVSPVVEGSVRARQERRNDEAREQVLPILIHGDAAFAGQGVVMETFNMSQARGFKTGGSIHLVINNQIGFTTSNPLDTRSTMYCTDVAKMVQAPIFHVNGDDPEAALMAAQLALDYRMTFKKDVVIDLVCYRRHGHNEADEPSATQPIMYKKIRELPATLVLYAQRLIQTGMTTQKVVDAMIKAYQAKLDAGDAMVADLNKQAHSEFSVNWHPYLKNDWTLAADTTYDINELKKLATQLTVFPEDFKIQPQVNKVMQDRKRMTQGEMPVNWGYAENLAYATLLQQGISVRLSGQDSGRGTFAHRHAVIHDQNTGNIYIPLRHVDQNSRAQFLVIDSLLSEEAVLGFEYGYATANPQSLVIWEAQFGDFANGAQVVIDQFISSGEQKWGRLCGLVMLLPHGYEGMGPEHSSARLERYLQLCAEHNIQVCVPTTPAQIYHMLRRQMLRSYRKPLIVMTPKSLLRHRLAVSTLDDLANGHFQLVIGEVDDIDPKAVRKIILCSGKVYYDLLTARREKQIKDTVIIRIEQLYPFPKQQLQDILRQYSQVKHVVWCQEEPKNQGAWYCSQHHLQASISAGQQLQFAGRPASASPAAGYLALHTRQQTALVEQALKPIDD